MPRIDSVDLFYLAMPKIEDVGDGSQDALLVRVRCGDEVGWGECEAAPLVSIAALVCPMSHSACHPVQDSVLGERLDEIADIARIGDRVRARSLDLLQADHTLSGIDMALWDLLGRRLGEPVWRLLGYRRAFAKLPYASQLFGATPEETLAKGRTVRRAGYRAAKFGWGPFGTGSPRADRDQLMAAREGLGEDAILLVDAGTVWGADVERARATLPAVRECRALWLEEPFVSGAFDAYRALAAAAGGLRLAGGEGAHDYWLARAMIDHAAIGFVQIDAGRIGGISVAKRVADYAAAKGVTYVNHTFTSHLALSASLQPFAGLEGHEICEYPVEARALARAITREHLVPDAEGLLRLPDAPGLGVTVDREAIRPYLQEVEITVGGRTLYRTPVL
jgi:L-alanine-DL-glutamate epimerase-like enolase superfamily enzyme